MSDKLSILKPNEYDWQISKPIMRYVVGITFVLAVSSLMGYPLAYLTTVLGLGYIAPGVKPLTLKQAAGFMLALIVINILAFIFSSVFIDYPLVFMPLLALAILWLYYSDKLPMMVKLFAIISILVIPLVSLEANFVGGFVAASLVLNAFMAIILSQLVFFVFPWTTADEEFVKSKQAAAKKSDCENFIAARNILIVLLPVLLLFFIFKLSGGLLILIFIAILSMSPALANIKVGSVMIVANIFGGLFAIFAYKLLTVVPHFIFMLLLVLLVGFLFAPKRFSKSKLAPIFGTGFSTFLLILGSVTSSDSEAGSEVWSRVIQIAAAVIYVVVAFQIVNFFFNKKEIVNE